MTKEKEEAKQLEAVLDETVNPPIMDIPIHLDEFFSTKTDLKEEVKAGFRVYMRGRSYQKSFADFEKELENYFKRDINK